MSIKTTWPWRYFFMKLSDPNTTCIAVKTHNTYLKNIIPDCFAVAEKQSNSNVIYTNTMIVSVNLVVVLAATNLKIVSIM